MNVFRAWARISLLLFAPSLLFIPQLSVADERMQIILTDQKGVAGAVERALPILWERLLPTSAYHSMEPVTDGQRLMRRIIPGQEEVLVEFDREAVFHYLRQHNTPYLVASPAFHLTIHMRNSLGDTMPQSQLLILEHAKTVLSQWGITLHESAPRLDLNWQWLPNNNIELMVLTTGKMTEFSEIRLANIDEPLMQLKQWLEEVLLRARDAYAYQVAEQAELRWPEEQGVRLLTIERALSLSMQVELEQALRADPRMISLRPYQYTHQLQRYRLETAGDAQWLSGWFARYNYNLQTDEHGWIAK